jgi:hypothetical protein
MNTAIAVVTAGVFVAPSIEAAELPVNYERAKEALATCSSIDECKDWADKMAALASYAKQADDQSLHQLAVRISSRAIRRCGDLLQEFENAGARTDIEPPMGTHGRLTQRQAADAAGLSEHQELQAVRVSKVPDEEFEAAVEREHPATVTELAEMGKTARPKRDVPPKFQEATYILGVLRPLEGFLAANPAREVAGAIRPHEVKQLRAWAEATRAWLHELLAHLPEGTC